MKAQRQVAFTTDKHGRPIAYRWCSFGMRWFRMSYAEAELQVSTEQARQVPYINWNRYIETGA